MDVIFFLAMIGIVLFGALAESARHNSRDGFEPLDH
jgi:hypothetical protein